MQIAVALGELALRQDGLALALFLGRNSNVNGYCHQGTSVASTT